MSICPWVSLGQISNTLGVGTFGKATGKGVDPIPREGGRVDIGIRIRGICQICVYKYIYIYYIILYMYMCDI